MRNTGLQMTDEIFCWLSFIFHGKGNLKVSALISQVCALCALLPSLVTLCWAAGQGGAYLSHACLHYEIKRCLWRGIVQWQEGSASQCVTEHLHIGGRAWQELVCLYTSNFALIDLTCLFQALSNQLSV